MKTQQLVSALLVVIFSVFLAFSGSVAVVADYQSVRSSSEPLVDIPVQSAIAISGGHGHTCLLTATGGVKCWGRNDVGQLGDGTSMTRLTPVSVVSLTTGVTAITAGAFHTCALMTNGTVKCWGENVTGGLGNNTTIISRTPVNVCSDSTCGSALSGVTAISAGWGYTCAVKDGGAKCWGINASGQLGSGEGGTGCPNHNCQLTPVDVSGLTSGVTSISASPLYHTCAVKDGGAKCWGNNSEGQLGDDTRTGSYTPVNVLGLNSGVTSVTTGGYFTCALLAAGGVKCWGDNYYGQLGDGVTTVSWSLTPVSVCSDPTCGSALSGVTEITSGDTHTCALLATGGVKCWGWNYYGQIGDGGGGTNCGGMLCQRTPVYVSGLSSGVTRVGAGELHSCALITNANVKCWGHNYYGQIGDGTTIDRLAPVDIVGFGVYPDFKQDNNNPWSPTPIADKNNLCDAMSQKGCAVTSIADVLAYYGVTVYGVPADPGNMNQWLGNNEGFSDCNVRWWQLARLTGSSVSVSSALTTWNQRQTQINNALEQTNKELAIVSVYPNIPNQYLHYVVIIGNAGTNSDPDYIINDPLMNAFGQGNQSGKKLSQTVYGRVADLVSRNYLQTIVIHRPGSGVPPGLSLYSQSPIQVLVTDPNGNQTGYNSVMGTYLQNIPGSTYFIEGNINDTNTGSSTPTTVYFHQDNPASGKYNIDVIGTGTGPYSLDFVATNQSGAFSSSFQTGQISQGQIQTTQVTYSLNSGITNQLFLPFAGK